MVFPITFVIFQKRVAIKYFERLRQSITCLKNKFTQGTAHAFKKDIAKWMDMNTLYGGFAVALIDELL